MFQKALSELVENSIAKGFAFWSPLFGNGIDDEGSFTEVSEPMLRAGEFYPPNRVRVVSPKDDIAVSDSLGSIFGPQLCETMLKHGYSQVQISALVEMASDKAQKAITRLEVSASLKAALAESLAIADVARAVFEADGIDVIPQSIIDLASAGNPVVGESAEGDLIVLADGSDFVDVDK